MPKLLLINPPAPFLAYPNSAPHVGIGYLISFLRGNDIEVDYLNLECANPSDIIIPEGYKYYGITSVTAQYFYSKLILNQIKERKLGSTIIGGAHPSLLPIDCLHDGFDYVVKGYGESALLKIVKGEIGGGIIQGELFHDLDLLPFPAWEDLFSFDYEMSYGKNVAHLFSMRGCPYTCTYCATGEIYGLNVGFRSIKNVVDEVIMLKEKYNIDRLYFLDPTFTVNKKRAQHLANALKELDVTWTCETRVDCIDETTIKALASGGCDLISFGIETGSEDVHNNLGKRTTIEQNKFAIQLAHDSGIKVKAFLMGALPDDNWRTVDQFKEFINTNKPDTWLFSTFIPFPGTDQWKNPNKYKINIECKDFRAYYNLGLNGRGPINISNQYLTRDELYELRDDMLRHLLNVVPNKRVEKAIENFHFQKTKFIPYTIGLEEKYLF
jgi:radical SAM superfamily enzyme YgiQ (UPF0313 family)